MATLVKGDKIKENSIPLNALDDNLKSEFNCKYGLSGVVCILNSNNTTSDIFPIGDYFVYVSSKKTIIKLNIGGQTDLSQLNGPSTIITSEAISGSKVKFFVSGEGISFYGNLIIGNKYNEVPIPTPDWNAQEGEDGYIENRTHYTQIKDFTTINDKDVESTHTFIFQSDYTFFYKKEDDVVFEVKLPIACDTIDNVKEDDWVEIHAYGPPLEVVRTLEGVFIRNRWGYVANKNIYFWKEKILALDSKYIPDTVVKTTPQTLSDSDKNQALANLGIADLLEALKPVRLSGDIPVGNVTQEQLDEIGLTEKFINNIINGYTNRIYITGSIFYVIYAYVDNINLEFTIANYIFNSSGYCDTLVQYKCVKSIDGFYITKEDV